MKFRAITAAAAVLAAVSASASAQEQAAAETQDSAASDVATSPDVNLTPRRLVFTPADRGVKEITVFNRTNATATYSIVLVDQVMTPTGALVAVDKAPDSEKARLKSAAKMLRYSPRQVTLGPQSSQTVRVQARPPAGAAAAEYRTHFSVTATPPADTGTDIAAAAGGAQATGLQIRLTPVYGIMIPIIVRTGDLPAQATISNAHIVEAGSQRGIQFAINRSGDRSVYGGVEVFLLGSGSPKLVAGIKGLGVYGELDSRTVTLPFAKDAPAVGPGSRIKIVYTDDELNAGTVLAETETTLS